MKFNLAAVTAASVLALASVGAQAVVVLGPVPPTATFSSTVGGAFSDTYQFSLSQPSTVTAAALNVSFLLSSGASFGGITGFKAVLNGVEIFGPTSSVEMPAGSGTWLTTQTKAGLASLAAGTYSLVVSGTGVTGGFATYTGYVQAVPVPEPETYAMLAAGLGIVGFVASRRRRND